ncbi:MAG TPA: hypothetical protein VGK24_05725 [Candidatus Angelobacter sp.]|jgi:hypothetical protein
MTFWRWLTTSLYTRHLEQEVASLQQQLSEERSQHREDVKQLTAALSPALLKLVSQGQAPVSAVVAEQIKPAHRIHVAEDKKSAECVCGWAFGSVDPADLQNAIAQHRSSYVKPVQINRARWSGPNGARARLEAEAAKEV